MHPIAAIGGAGLLALAIVVGRRRGDRAAPPWLVSSAEVLGLVLFLGPPLLRSLGSDAALLRAILLAQALAVLVAALAFRRPWPALAAIAIVALESARAIVEVVERLPNFVTFAVSGALLLIVGFLLLLKRELFDRWRARLMRWWVGWIRAAR